MGGCLSSRQIKRASLPTRWVYSGTGLELVTRPATIRYLVHSATAASTSSRPRLDENNTDHDVHDYDVTETASFVSS
ncbi:hypothetical protein TNCV_3251711 [Trichonephila clavipes]|nr:hypothetical protein TNCV_3251711 [Trichonephila clavipes]